MILGLTTFDIYWKGCLQVCLTSFQLCFMPCSHLPWNEAETSNDYFTLGLLDFFQNLKKIPGFKTLLICFAHLNHIGCLDREKA